jgi:hypothetical protein
METVLRSPHLLQGQCLLPHTLPALYAAASSPAGCEALLSATITAAKRQQADQAVLAALVEAGGQLKPAAAAVVAAVPGPLGRALAEQVQWHTATTVQQALSNGVRLASLAEALLTRAAALLDAELGQAAANRAKQLPAGRIDKPWAVEALFDDPGHSALLMLPYKIMLGTSPQQLAAVTKGMKAALIQQHAAPARKQAAKLAQGLGSFQPADTEQLYQQLQGMWLGRDVQKGPDVSDHPTQELPGAGLLEDAYSSPPAGSAALVQGPGGNPGTAMCEADVQQTEDVLAAGDPAMSGAAAHSISTTDLQVAATALLAACKAAGAVAQLPQLLEQVAGIMEQQPWGQTAAASMDLSRMDEICSSVAEWVLLLAPVVARLLPAGQAVQLKVMAVALGYGSGGDSEDDSESDIPTDSEDGSEDCSEGDSEGGSEFVHQLSPGVVSRVLGLLDHVVAPGAPGCSYPGCCNLEGRSEAELPLQVCSKCKGARYCCREHQAAQWKAGHRDVCWAAQAALKHVCDVAVGGSDQAT